MKHEGAFNRIISVIFGDKVAVRENLFYNTFKGSLDFAPDDLPNWRAVLAVVPGGGETAITTPIVSGVTSNPITVNYGTMVNPTIILRNVDGSNYSGSGHNVDNGVEIILTGDDDGTGHFIDTFTFILKP